MVSFPGFVWVLVDLVVSCGLVWFGNLVVVLLCAFVVGVMI